MGIALGSVCFDGDAKLAATARCTASKIGRSLNLNTFEQMCDKSVAD